MQRDVPLMSQTLEKYSIFWDTQAVFEIALRPFVRT
jgi:hypothetical protein